MLFIDASINRNLVYFSLWAVIKNAAIFINVQISAQVLVSKCLDYVPKCEIDVLYGNFI